MTRQTDMLKSTMKTSFLAFFCGLALTVAGASDKAPKKVDMVAQKRVQYGRVLYPPQEKGFNQMHGSRRSNRPT